VSSGWDIKLIGSPYLSHTNLNNKELSNAILQIISDTQFRDDLITKGKARATLFSWDRTARETLEVYKSIHGMKT
jgi:glycosyltransferase involved in cell wall biosynthesis